MKTTEQPKFPWVAFIGSLVCAVFNCCTLLVGGTPNHGLILELTLFEWLLILWVPAAVIFFKKQEPDYWWGCFGVVSFALLFPTIHGFILHGPGRRPWLIPDLWYLRFALLFFYFLIVPFLVAKLKRSFLRFRDGGHGFSSEPKKAKSPAVIVGFALLLLIPGLLFYAFLMQEHKKIKADLENPEMYETIGQIMARYCQSSTSDVTWLDASLSPEEQAKVGRLDFLSVTKTSGHVLRYGGSYELMLDENESNQGTNVWNLYICKNWDKKWQDKIWYTVRLPKIGGKRQ